MRQTVCPRPPADGGTFLPLLFIKKIYHMKLHTIMTALAMLGIFFFTACGNDGDASRDAAVESTGIQPTDGAAATPAATMPTPPAASPATPEPPQNAEGVWHYTCSTAGCDGGGGAAGACPKCGGNLAHNTAYHASTTTPTATPPQPTITGDNPLTPVTTPTPEPAKNASGVWHYTCSNASCDGGGGAAGACPKCGGTLAHNTAYHQ